MSFQASPDRSKKNGSRQFGVSASNADTQRSTTVDHSVMLVVAPPLANQTRDATFAKKSYTTPSREIEWTNNRTLQAVAAEGAFERDGCPDGILLGCPLGLLDTDGALDVEGIVLGALETDGAFERDGAVLGSLDVDGAADMVGDNALVGVGAIV